jgi:hypothetical protein
VRENSLKRYRTVTGMCNSAPRSESLRCRPGVLKYRATCMPNRRIGDNINYNIIYDRNRDRLSLCNIGILGKVDLMRHEGDYIDSGTTSNCLILPCETCRFMRCKHNPYHHSLRVAWPPDSLTRLLMETDGVTESPLDAILKGVVQKWLPLAHPLRTDRPAGQRRRDHGRASEGEVGDRLRGMSVS